MWDNFITFVTALSYGFSHVKEWSKTKTVFRHGFPLRLLMVKAFFSLKENTKDPSKYAFKMYVQGYSKMTSLEP